MRSYTLFGLDESHQIVSTEKLSADCVEAVQRIAEDRLARFHRVEVWEASVCIVRIHKAQPA
jgi:hypothetical protein